jgi:quercetin dioxygenase-like cupin family protein
MAVPDKKGGRKMEGSIRGAEVFALKELVSCQAGAVVSRTIVQKNTGTVTLFAFDRGQGLSEHTAPFDALACIIEGEAVITVSGREFRLKEGEAMIMPAGEPHALKGVEQFKMLLIMIKA